MGKIKSLEAQNKALSEQFSQQSISPPPISAHHSQPRKLRSEDWFSNENQSALNALYVDRYFNYGLTAEELMSRRPIIGIAQTGSDLSPCNRYHLETAKRVRDGIISHGGIPVDFPTHPIQESCRRPTATLDRNLSYLTLVEILHGYPLDGVVLLTGCDKTTPACLMAAATMVSSSPVSHEMIR
jgi:dihydroxyacid dehydratase/phosphogluconate dehydratase